MKRKSLVILIALFAIIPITLMAARANASARLESPQPVIAQAATATGLDTLWEDEGTQAEGVLRIIAADGSSIEQPFAEGSNPFEAASRATLSDGHYSWEVRLMPTLSAETMDALHAARNADADTRAALVAQLRASGKLPDPNSLIQSGGFAIVNGRVADISLEEAEADITTRDGGTRDQVIVDDLIVDGSACIGQDCTNGEDFGFDTLRVKENNVRVNFEDTSNSASFPGSDWTITSNDSSNGGRNYLAFSEDNANYLSFVISAGAGANALYVGQDGKVGLGTSTPATALHVADGDTPGIRLDQDGTAGFPQQVWNINANESSLAIQDGTGAATPFRIFTGAPDNSIVVDATGNVGVGFITPTVKLEVDGDVRVHGTLTELSDRASKENITTIDTQAMLRQLLNIPVYQWNYIKDTDSKQHIGPMAQDVFAQTGIGTDTTLASLDVNGMLIAGVQALHDDISDRDETIRALEAQNADLETRLEQLEAAVEALLAEGE